MSSSTGSNTTQPTGVSLWPGQREMLKYVIMLAFTLSMVSVFANVEGAQSQAFGVQAAFSWLLAYMFFLSICLGSLFLVLLHHLFDSAWSAPLRRVFENMASLIPWMALGFLPIIAFGDQMYGWMAMETAGNPDHALHAKHAYLNKPFFYFRAVLYFSIWTWLTHKLRYWSVRQDTEGTAECTFKMRKFAYMGVFLFAFTLTLAAIDWVKSLEHAWFSTMFGVYYFASSVWLTLGTMYALVVVLSRNGPLTGVVGKRQFYDLGLLFFAFTVFYAYIHFSQYFLIWNANIPEETYYYVNRETGSWWDISMLIIFGHFFIPFLCLLRIDAKLSFAVVIPMAAWAWLMHYIDLSFNIMPVLHPEGFSWSTLWIDISCMVAIGGFLLLKFMDKMGTAAPYPLKDPRLKEALEEIAIEQEASHDAEMAKNGLHS